MNHEELKTRLVQAGLDAGGRQFVWLPRSPSTGVQFNVVFADGRYQILGGDGRDGFYSHVGNDGLPLEFLSEDDVCDYIWERLSQVQPSPSPIPTRDADEEKHHREIVIDRYLQTAGEQGALTEGIALGFIRAHNLQRFNWFEDREPRSAETGIIRSRDHVFVYSSDLEGRVEGSSREFLEMSPAIAKFLIRLLASNRV